MNRELNIDQTELVGAWQERLPEVLNVGDQAQVMADGYSYSYRDCRTPNVLIRFQMRVCGLP